jgi:hypothetical protein
MRTTADVSGTERNLALKLSLVANVLLLGALCLRPVHTTEPVNSSQMDHTASGSTASTSPSAADAPARASQTNPARLDWIQIESTDYPTYINNLRKVGCPEQTVREIITADVADLYAQKRQELGLDLSGFWVGRWSRDEENALVARLFGEPQLSASRQVGLAGQDPVSMPLAFQSSGLEGLDLTEEQKADLEWLKREFVRDIGGANQDPKDPAYLERWQKAQPKADELLIGVIGRDGIIELDQTMR